MVDAFLAMRPVSDLAYLVDRALDVAPTDIVLLRLKEELADIARSRETLADTARIARAGQAVRRAYASLDPASLQNS